ncbi:MAG: hypothetical protein JWP27_1678 [Flaviaesturariibacter sp.]|nr:hypothetical protein [Flaviaesturariibacter sp.]
MKKTILALALVGCGAAAGAQDSLKTNASMQNSNGQNSMDLQTHSSTGSYNAYGTATNVPSTTQSYLLRDYPTATDASWQQAGDWYRANVINNNRNLQVYYAPNGNSYTVALPVIQSWVPEEVVTSALNMYGSNIYSVNKIRGANGQDLYQVTVLDNGMSRSEYLSADGSTVAAIDVFRTDNMEMNANTGSWNTTSNNAAMGSNSGQDMNNSNTSDMSTNSDMNANTSTSNGTMGTKTKSKVVDQNGNVLKVKTKEGKTKIKEKPTTTSGDMNNE